MGLAFFTAFFEIGRRDVVDDNEGQRAAPPAEMLRSGDFIIPTINEDDYLKKPPLIYWMIAGVYALTGVISPVTARIPTAISFVVLVVAVYLYGRRAMGESAARWGALALMTCPYLVDRGRYAELDTPLTLATFLAVIAFWKACDAPNVRSRTAFALLSGIALGAAILLKGPVPFLFLTPAWIAFMVVSSPDRDEWIRNVLAWTGVTFGIGVALWLLELAAPALVKPVSVPVALLLTAALWIFFAWRHSGPVRGRALAVFLCVMAIGIALAAPWGIAVLMRKGWPYIETLIRTESLERTHMATRINSGSPFYYLLGLIGMAAPWSLLLPCQVSSRWKLQGPAYQRCLFSGWLSVLVFSLIAGKEYEYIMPGLPLLVMAIGKQIDDTAGWTARWCAWWRDFTPWLLALLAVVFLVLTFRTTREGAARLDAEASLLAVLAIASALYGLKHAERRLAAISVMALCVVMLWTFSQNYRYTGQRSFKPIATLSGQLVRAGYRVEAAKVYPAFAFYAAVKVPEVREEETVRARLDGSDPYYCVLPKEWLQSFSPPLDDKFITPLLGPYGTKKLILLGNRPLPKLGGKTE